MPEWMEALDMLRKISVTFVIDDEIERELDQLLLVMQGYTNPATGRQPFLEYDKDQLFRIAVETGGVPYARERLSFLKKNLTAQGIVAII